MSIYTKETEEMEEKKFKDMTGNREEKIASKRPVADTSSAEAPRAPKRPFVRVAPGADQAEKISAKKPQAEQTDTSKGKAHGANGKPERNAEQKQGDKTHGHGKPRHHRGGRNQQGAPKETAHAAPEKEQQVNPPKAEPSAAQSGEQKPRRDRKPKHDRQRDRKPAAQETRPEKKEAAVPEKAPEPAQNGKRDKRRDRHAKREDRVLTETVAVGQEKKTPREEFTDEQLRADGLWFSLDEEPTSEQPVAVEEAVPAAEEETVEVVGIRFRGAGKTYYFAPAGISFETGEHAIVETVRGVEYGDVAMGNRSVSVNEVVQPLKPVLRKSTAEDDAHFAANREQESKAKPIFYEKVAKNKLEMQLVDVEYTFDNTKLCFYFTAEGRVDFRELVKDLASVFRTRIELRQIGVRDEARLFGGLGVCGRPFCCKSFLADFTQVSIKMAKEQNLSLASAKISGSCGRLMCCLRYEQDTYERENALLPRVGSTVDTPKGRATVLESNFLTGKLKVSDGNDGTIRFHAIDEVKFVAPPPRKNAQEDASENADEALPNEG